MAAASTACHERVVRSLSSLRLMGAAAGGLSEIELGLPSCARHMASLRFWLGGQPFTILRPRPDVWSGGGRSAPSHTFLQLCVPRISGIVGITYGTSSLGLIVSFVASAVFVLGGIPMLYLMRMHP